MPFLKKLLSLGYMQKDMENMEAGLRPPPERGSVPGGKTEDGRQVIWKPDNKCERSILCFLRKNGFIACPEFLFLDDDGRACYALPKGKAPPSTAVFTEKQFRAFMKLLRRMHDAGAGESDGLVVCHHDLLPANVLFDPPYGHLGSLPCAIVHWDVGCYGRRWEDIVYACWLWLDIGNPTRDSEETLSRIAAGLDAYAGDNSALRREICTDFAERLCVRMETVAFRWETQGDPTPDIRRWVNSSQHWVFEHRDALNALEQPGTPLDIG